MMIMMTMMTMLLVTVPVHGCCLPTVKASSFLEIRFLVLGLVRLLVRYH